MIRFISLDTSLKGNIVLVTVEVTKADFSEIEVTNEQLEGTVL